jgi:hypothetical protein
MASFLKELPSEHLSLLNSLLRNGDTSVREIARQLYPIMGNVGHQRSERAFEMMIYRWKESGSHMKVVREGNLLADKYAITDLQIMAIEAALSDKQPNIALLNILKSTKPVTKTIIDQLTESIDERIKRSGQEPPNTLLRDTCQHYS